MFHIMLKFFYIMYFSIYTREMVNNIMYELINIQQHPTPIL